MLRVGGAELRLNPQVFEVRGECRQRGRWNCNGEVDVFGLPRIAMSGQSYRPDEQQL